MLTAAGLAYGYRGAVVGRDVSLSAASGEVLCLLGPNGCGKTTLFKTLLGLIPPLAGRVEVDGRDIATLDRATFARHVAYVPQAQSALFPFGVLDVVLMGRASRIGAFSAPSADDRRVAREALEAMGIPALADRLYTELSGGERQMVLIARALAQGADIVIMDEPTASLDFGNQTTVLARIRTLAAGGRTVVFSSHDPGHAFASADRVALMRGGRLVATGSPQVTVTPDMLRQLYDVAVAIEFLPSAGRNVCVPLLDPINQQGETS